MKIERKIVYLRVSLFFLFIFLLSGAVSAQKETIIWSKQDADPYINLAFSHDGSILALGRQDSNTSDFVNAQDGTLIRSFTSRFNSTNDLIFTSDDQYLINGTGQGGSTVTLNLWRVADSTRVIGPLNDHTNGTTSISLSPDGGYLATSGNFDRDINIWHVPDLTRINNIVNFDKESGTTPRVKDVKFSPDGQTIATGDAHGIKLRRAADGQLILTIPGDEIPSIAFSPDGAYIAGAAESEHAVKIRRTADGVLVRSLPVLNSDFAFPKIAFSPNGRVIAAGYHGALEFWRMLDGRVLSLVPQDDYVHSIKFAPGGSNYAYTLTNGRIVFAYAPFVW
jgi:WD40 repeat protein